MKVIDKIRAMSAEELAELIYKIEINNEEFDRFCKKKLVMNEHDELVCPHNYDRCRECIKEWLESEVQE